MAHEPAPVLVANDEPIPVAVASSPDTTAQSDAKAIAASSAVDARVLTTQGQRRINLIWERTQAIIAISVVVTALFVIGILIVVPILRGGPLDPTAVTGVVLLSTLVSNVQTAYFQRTNHTRTGGVGGDEVGR